MAAFRRPRNPEGRMSLGDHLRELRRRVFISALAILVGAVIGWIYYDEVYQRLASPFYAYKEASGNELVSLNFSNATAAFSQQVSISIFVGVLLSSPVWLYQLWAFIVPGLTKKEKRVSLAFVAAIVPLFLAGCWMAYVTMPKALTLLYGFTPEGASNIQQTSDYFGFVTRFIMVFGLAFLLPVFLVALNVAHVISARGMLRTWRPAVFIIFVFAAVATPTPDPFTMFLLAAPLTLLYFAAIGVSFLVDRRREKTKPEWAELPDDQASTL
jgi:sec-independent protein translocase protein TatC